MWAHAVPLHHPFEGSCRQSGRAQTLSSARFGCLLVRSALKGGGSAGSPAVEPENSAFAAQGRERTWAGYVPMDCS